MRLTVEAIERIKGRNDLKKDLITSLKISRISLWRYLNENLSDGPLTKMSSLELISKKLNSDISELVCETEAVNAP